MFEALVVCYVEEADEGSRRRVATKRQWKRHWCLGLCALLQQSHLEASVRGASSIRYTCCYLTPRPAGGSLLSTDSSELINVNSWTDSVDQATCLLVKPLQSQLSTDVQISQNLNKVNYTWNQNTHTVDQRHAFEAPKFKTVVAGSGSGHHYCNLPQMLNYPFLHLTTMPKTLPNNPKNMVVFCDQHEFGRSGQLSTLIKPL